MRVGPSLTIVEEHKGRGSHLIPAFTGQMGPWEGRAAPAQYEGASLLCWELVRLKPRFFPGSFPGRLQTPGLQAGFWQP